MMFFFTDINNAVAKQHSSSSSVSNYTVQPKDTWTALSRKFHVTVKELQALNPTMKELKIGKTIIVPGSSSTLIVPVQNKTTTLKKETIYHTVKPGETLYKISKLYDKSVEDIKKWNSLTNNNIPLGKKLIVGYEVSHAKDEVHAPKEISIKKDETAAIKQDSILKPVVENSTVPVISNSRTDTVPLAPGSIEKITETGVAMWFDDQELNQNKF